MLNIYVALLVSFSGSTRQQTDMQICHRNATLLCLSILIFKHSLNRGRAPKIELFDVNETGFETIQSLLTVELPLSSSPCPCWELHVRVSCGSCTLPSRYGEAIFAVNLIVYHLVNSLASLYLNQPHEFASPTAGEGEAPFISPWLLPRLSQLRTSGKQICMAS